jgi:hypothetical protein
MKQTDQPRTLQMSLQEAEQAQMTCKTKQIKDKANAAKLNKEFEKLVNAKRAIKYKTSVETQEKITKNAFQSKRTHSRIKKVMDKKPRAAMTYVEYTDEHGLEKECTTGEETDIACIKEGYKRYAQSNNSPFLASPLLEDFGFLGNQNKVQDILDGTYDCPGDVDEFTKKFIHELRRPDTASRQGTITGYTTTEESIKSWKKMRACTAASTFGPSFPEIIAGTEDATIAEVDAAIVSITALTGYCPKQWSEAIDWMIPKKADSKHVEKLCIIVLFHSLFNMLNKKVARQATQSAITLDAIPSKAYAKPGFRSNDCGLNKVLSYDIIRQRRTPAALCSNDVKSCYDRIVHSIANICLQRVGVQANTCQVMLGTLQQMKHYVKAAYGTSEQSYGSIRIPLQGVLQGNGAGPAIWLLISSSMINMLRTQGFGFTSPNLLSDESYTFACYTYVDDTDLIHNSKDQNPNSIILDMQRMLYHWAGALRATGGALVPSKSY